MKVTDILASIDQGTMALPEFQRGYVWSRDQVRGVMTSLYKRYPVGSLLVWQTHANVTAIKGDQQPFGNIVQLLLDGQQRVTTLYGIMRGEAPPFFQGNERAFTDLYFDLRTEAFQFYGPVKMKGDPLWVSVTELFRGGIGPWFEKLGRIDEIVPEEQAAYFQRLNAILEIGNLDLHIEQIVGSDRSVDEVVDIFNQVNSGGTKLSKGDLTLARICAEWPQARQQMNEMLGTWDNVGFKLKLDWLLRVTNAIATRQADFEALRNVPADRFGEGLDQARKAVDQLLNLVASRLGIDHDRVLGGRYAFPIMARFVAQHDGPMPADTQQRLLFWYLHAALWGRHSGSTETVLQQDLQSLDQGVDGLIRLMELWRGDLRIKPDHFAGSDRRSRFYPMLYVLSRVGGAQDLCTGIELKQSLLGKLARLELHHIFPKARLREAGHPQPERNALANFCFLTQDCNLRIGKRMPEDYLAEVHALQPAALTSQWIPADPGLWKIENYDKFLAARRELLAEAANDLLDDLRAGITPIDQGGRLRSEVAKNYDEVDLAAIHDLVTRAGLSDPDPDFEITDEESGDVLVVADAAWPRGMQEGLGEPIAYLQESDELDPRLAETEYRVFSDLGALHAYVEELVHADLDGDGTIGGAPSPDDEATVGAELALPDAAVAMVQQMAPPAEAEFRLDYLRRCVDELGLEVRLAPSNRLYVNVYPRSDRWTPRAASLRPGSGRVALFVEPELAGEYATGEMVTHGGEPAYVRIYLRSATAVDDAIDLTRRALAQT